MESIIKFKSKQVRGAGRGHRIGFPTINLFVPGDFDMEDGIYAVRVKILNSNYIGALHYGPIPTFDEVNKTTEVYLLDVDDASIPNVADNEVEIEVVKFLRKIKKFEGITDLAKQIKLDVHNTRLAVL